MIPNPLGAPRGRLGCVRAPVAVLLLAFTTACGPSPPEPELPPVRPHVALVLIDTLRADHLGTYGYHRDTSPFLDELASNAIVFEDAVSAASATFPSVNSLLTSRESTPFFGSAKNLGIPPELTTLAEIFAANGYQTGAVSASPIVRKTASEINPGAGFGRGFDYFDESCGNPRFTIPSYTAPCVTERTAELLEKLTATPERPFFLYVHYLDPHDPYQPPSDESGFVRPYEGKDFVSRGHTWPITRWLLGQGDDPDISDRDLAHLVDLYDAEIRAVDAELRRLMDRFSELGLRDQTLFAFLSDHGESFLEHDVLQHSYSLYQTELRVPLILYWPARWSQGERYPEPVCSIDVMPTLLTLADLPVPDDASGLSLLEPDGSLAARDRSCLSAARSDWRSGKRSLTSLRRGRDKIIYDSTSGAYMFYDLASDAGETVNLAPSKGEPASARFEALRRELHGRNQALAPAVPGTGDERIELEPEAERALRALGYID